MIYCPVLWYLAIQCWGSYFEWVPFQATVQAPHDLKEFWASLLMKYLQAPQKKKLTTLELLQGPVRNIFAASFWGNNQKNMENDV